MACWRCVICFVFVALTLKSLLSHINTAHSRSPDFRVICGIDGCTAEYRLFNSFYYHIRRTHVLYFTTGQPPTGWMTAATSDISRVGSEHFDIPVFSDCATETREMQRTNSEVNTPVISNEMLNPEPTCHQIPHPDNQEGAGASSANIRRAAAFAINVRERCHLSQFRSKLAAIRLLAIAKADDIDKCGVDFVLQRIDEDLKLLYNGVTIQTQSGGFELFGAVVSVCGDTLAQNELAGFKERVGFAYSKCRHCECTFEEMQINFNEESFTKRTMEKHIRQCHEIEIACTDFLKSALKTTYGINRRSKLVDFPAFDLIQQTPQDIMHIILEGVAPMEIKCVLKYLVLSG
ncbi:hypothetical protein PAMP_004408 [Pampus punctatissimus]